ncbi:MAG: hypothetical protein VW032_03560, partial [Pontimonas sp.]
RSPTSEDTASVMIPEPMTAATSKAVPISSAPPRIAACIAPLFLPSLSSSARHEIRATDVIHPMFTERPFIVQRHVFDFIEDSR